MFAEVSLGAPDNAIGFVMWRIVQRYQREVDRALAPCSLTSLQFITLALVAWYQRQGQAATQIELARGAGIHPMQLSQTLKLLDGKKMVARKQSKSDARSKRVEVTRSGLHTLHQALPRVIKVQSQIFGESGRSGGELLEKLLELHNNLPDEAE